MKKKFIKCCNKSLALLMVSFIFIVVSSGLPIISYDSYAATPAPPPCYPSQGTTCSSGQTLINTRSVSDGCGGTITIGTCCTPYCPSSPSSPGSKYYDTGGYQSDGCGSSCGWISSWTYDGTSPYIGSVTRTPSTWTNGSVTVSATATDSGVGPSSQSLSQTTSSNGYVNFTASDSLANIGTLSVLVSNIDKTNPVISSVTASSNNSVWSKSKTISVSAYDNGDSGWSASGIRTYSPGSSFSIDTNGTKYVSVTDNAGNSASSSIYIDHIDNTAPSIDNIQYNINSSGWTNSYSVWTENDVQLKIASAHDNGDSGWNASGLASGRGIGQEQTATINGTYTFTVTDVAGNSTNQSITVPNIDKVAPVVTLSQDPVSSTWTNRDVKINVSALDKGSGLKRLWLQSYTRKDSNLNRLDENGNKLDNYSTQYSLDNSYASTTTPSLSYWDLSSSSAPQTNNSAYFYVPENGTYTVWAEDYLGNQSSTSITVSNIDKIVPNSIVYTPITASNNTRPDTSKWPAGIEVSATSDDTAADNTYGKSGIKQIYYLWSSTDYILSNVSTDTGVTRTNPTPTGMILYGSTSQISSVEQLYTGANPYNPTTYYLYLRVIDNAGNQYTTKQPYIITRPNKPTLTPINKANNSTDVTQNSIYLRWDRQGNYKNTVYEIFRQDDKYDVLDTPNGSIVNNGVIDMRTLNITTSQDAVNYNNNLPALNANRKYIYKVLAKIVSSDGTTYKAETESEPEFAYTKCANPKRVYLDSKSIKNIQIVWDSLDGNPENATKYRIRRIKTADNTTSIIAKTDEKQTTFDNKKKENQNVTKGGKSSKILDKQSILEYFQLADQPVKNSTDKVTVEFMKKSDTNDANCPVLLTLPEDDTILRIERETATKSLYYAYNDTKVAPNTTYKYIIEAVNGDGIATIDNVNSIGITVDEKASINNTFTRTTLPDILIKNLKITGSGGRAITGTTEINAGEEIAVAYDIEIAPGPHKYDKYLVEVELNDKQDLTKDNSINNKVITKIGFGAVFNNGDHEKVSDDNTKSGIFDAGNSGSYNNIRNVVNNPPSNLAPGSSTNKVSAGYSFRFYNKKGQNVTGQTILNSIRISGIRNEDKDKQGEGVTNKAGYDSGELDATRFLIHEIYTSEINELKTALTRTLKIN